VNTYHVTVRHDQGTVTITTTASCMDAAIASVMAHERCPRRAVVAAVEIVRGA
jgi:hypothetical protein